MTAQCSRCGGTEPHTCLRLVVEIKPSSQGPCTCPPEGIVEDCPRHAHAWDWVGSEPFKSRIAEDAWFNGARPS